jgi:hypothetical protein
MTDDIEVTVCCDAFADALDEGTLQLGQMENGEIVEVLMNSSGEGSYVINFCPFCGTARQREPEPLIKAAR